jgi:hypothetical protein
MGGGGGVMTRKKRGDTVRDLKRMETTRGNFVKGINGIGKRSRYSKLLLALGIPKITEIIKRNTVPLYPCSIPGSVSHRMSCLMLRAGMR